MTANQNLLAQLLARQNNTMPATGTTTNDPALYLLLAAMMQAKGSKREALTKTIADVTPIPKIDPADAFQILMRHLSFGSAVKYGIPGGKKIGQPLPANQ